VRQTRRQANGGKPGDQTPYGSRHRSPHHTRGDAMTRIIMAHETADARCCCAKDMSGALLIRRITRVLCASTLSASKPYMMLRKNMSAPLMPAPVFLKDARAMLRLLRYGAQAQQHVLPSAQQDGVARRRSSARRYAPSCAPITRAIVFADIEPRCPKPVPTR